MNPSLKHLFGDPADTAVILGSHGGIGSALMHELGTQVPAAQIVGFSRSGDCRLDYADEQTLADAAATMRTRGRRVRLMIVATGILEDGPARVEKSLAGLEADAMLHMLRINTVGPALAIKHFAPLLPRQGRSIVACLSARVGSIGDNRLGGWYSYRASKAALNQVVRTASIELRRKNPEAVCVALHPGTVDTPLSRDFAKSGLEVQPPQTAALRILRVLAALTPGDTGLFFDHQGNPVEW